MAHLIRLLLRSIGGEVLEGKRERGPLCHAYRRRRHGLRGNTLERKRRISYCRGVDAALLICVEIILTLLKQLRRQLALPRAFADVSDRR